jgi:hypothetical protein
MNAIDDALETERIKAAAAVRRQELLQIAGALEKPRYFGYRSADSPSPSPMVVSPAPVVVHDASAAMSRFADIDREQAIEHERTFLAQQEMDRDALVEAAMERFSPARSALRQKQLAEDRLRSLEAAADALKQQRANTMQDVQKHVEDLVRSPTGRQTIAAATSRLAWSAKKEGVAREKGHLWSGTAAAANGEQARNGEGGDLRIPGATRFLPYAPAQIASIQVAEMRERQAQAKTIEQEELTRALEQRDLQRRQQRDALVASASARLQISPRKGGTTSTPAIDALVSSSFNRYAAESETPCYRGSPNSSALTRPDGSPLRPSLPENKSLRGLQADYGGNPLRDHFEQYLLT